MNTIANPAQHALKKQEGLLLLTFSMDLAKEQLRNGKLFCFEHPDQALLRTTECPIVDSTLHSISSSVPAERRENTRGLCSYHLVFRASLRFGSFPYVVPEVLLYQSCVSRPALSKHLAEATSFQEPCVQKVMKTKGVQTVVFDQCLFGLVSEEGSAIPPPSPLKASNILRQV